MIINEYRYTHTSQTDGLPLSVLRIEPNESHNIKGIVQLVHGMCEHKERYVDFMRFLAEKGYITVIHDNRGHGESVKSKNDYGYFYEGGYKALIEDIHEITIETKKYAEDELGIEGLPYILMGHSMGSLAIRCYIKKYDYELDRLLVLGCPSNKPEIKYAIKLIQLICLIKGDKSHSKFVDKLVMDNNYSKKFKSEGPVAWLFKNPEAAKKILNDPLCKIKFTLSGYVNLLKLTIETYSESGYVMKNPGLKIKFLSGREDPCAVSKTAFANAMKLLKRQGYKNVSGKMYKGMRHEILNESENARVIKDILDFIK